ncbi:MAG TPA: hypothetical protein VFB03_01915 [Candidatus Saccharimonadales bacterium]|nr:hypothetical protein [Candidatus Saccharimonadales bacterium]
MTVGLKNVGYKLLTVCLIGLLVTVSSLMFPRGAKAAQLVNRFVQLSSATPSIATSYELDFTYASVSNVGSVVFEFCDNSPNQADPCNVPTGFSATGASLSAQSGNTGFSFDGADSTVNKVVISRPSAAIIPSASSYTLDNVVNPSISNYAVYVRISTYASSDGSGSSTDYGSAAFSTSTQLAVGAFIPPFLTFCVGVSLAVDCSSSTGNNVDLGVFKTSSPSTGTSQFSVATNDVSGYNITIDGTTMTSGNNVIPALSSPSFSAIGHSQFGINLRHNTFPNVGADPDGLGGVGNPTPDYNQPNLFVFRDSDSIANSSTSSYFRRMTVSYLVNIDSSQPPGIYASTFTYIATVQF